MFRSALTILVLVSIVAAAAPAQQPQLAPAAPASALSAETEPAAKPHHPSKHDRDQARQLFLSGAKALQHDQPRAALDAFTRAANLDPAEKKYQDSEQIARQHVVTDLIQQADKARILGHLEEAHADIAEAFRVDPSDPVVAQHVGDLASDAPSTSASLAITPLAPPIELRPKPVRLSFHLRNNERNLISQVLPAYGIQPTLDDSVGVTTVRFDVDNVDFSAAVRALSLATNTFLVPLDPARALVATNTRANHDKFERQAVETLYLGEFSPDEVTAVTQIAKDFFGATRATATGTGSGGGGASGSGSTASGGSGGAPTLTVHAPASQLAALNQTLIGLMEGRSEIQLDVRMFEIDRTKAVNLGVILPNQTSLFNVYSEARSLLNSNSSLVQEIISSGLAAPGDWEAILGILIASGQISSSIFSQPFGVFGGGLTMTGIAYQGGSLNMQLNSSDVRALDQIQLRLDDQQQGTIKAGERYPIETSSYSSLSAAPLSIPGLSTAGLSSTLANLGVNVSSLASAASQIVPQVQYQDIGLTLDVTPRVEGAGDVSLKFHLTLSSLAGVALNGLPELNNREYSAITSVPLGQTAIMMSALSRQESVAVTGIPGVSEIPGFQDTTNKNTNLNVAELVIVITPHIVRGAHREAQEKMILLPREP